MLRMRYIDLQGKGIRARITNYGAKIVSLMVPNRSGVMADVVLGFNTMAEWQTKETYFNAVIGRVANRIKDGRFTLEGKTYQLPINNGTNSLHGGISGFNEKIWDIYAQSRHSVTLRYKSQDGEEGYPGNLIVYVTYEMTRDSALKITYEATTDKPTICALTNHAYFNLKGEGEGLVNDHILQVYADSYTPFDDTACPMGEILPVDGTPMDMRQPVRIGDCVDDAFFVPGLGIDNNWCLGETGVMKHAATLSADGRQMEVYTTEPGIQVYTGNFLDGITTGKSGRVYPPRGAICLETQHYPNSVNIPQWKDQSNVFLYPGQTLHSETIYQFIL